MAGASLLFEAACRRQSHEPARGKTPPLAKFVDPLPVPPICQPRGSDGGVPFYEIGMSQFEVQIHRDLPPGLAWGFGDARTAKWSFPGPTFEVRRGRPIRVHWRNLLPATHLLPVDRTANMSSVPDVRTVVHLHGSRSHPASDGHPNAWFTPEGAAQTRGPQYRADSQQSETYDYPNDQRATMLHYHDHALGVTRLNVHAGLSGLYVIRDDFEDALIAAGLPSGPHEIPLVLQDRILSTSGPAFFYPSQYDREDLGPGKYRPLPEPSLIPEFFGDAALVNGKAWPYVDVEPRAYRLRILNGSPSRFYRVRLVESDARGDTLGGTAPGPAMVQIGSDGGFLAAPVPLPRLTLAPGERADVLVDFAASRSRYFVLWNDAAAPFPNGEPESILTPLMQFRVRDSTPAEPLRLPRLEPVPRWNASDRSTERDLTLSEDFDDYGRMRQRLGTLAEGPLFFHDPVTEAPRRGAIEIWRLINRSEDTHPIHLHLVHFQILSRQPIDTDQSPKVVYSGPPQAPAENERGWKDVVQAPPGTVTSIVARFDAPESWVYPGGQYMWHCHMLEHEDHDMMRPFQLRA